MKDADVVHHLAGVTDVPRVKSETSKVQDEKIKVAEKGTQYILDTIKDKYKIIFPSTHFIEGVNQVKNDIKEDEPTKPVLSYSTSKDINEKQIKNSEEFCNIKVGSVYGYSTDSMRVILCLTYSQKLHLRMAQ